MALLIGEEKKAAVLWNNNYATEINFYDEYDANYMMMVRDPFRYMLFNRLSLAFARSYELLNCVICISTWFHFRFFFLDWLWAMHFNMISWYCVKMYNVGADSLTPRWFQGYCCLWNDSKSLLGNQKTQLWLSSKGLHLCDDRWSDWPKLYNVVSCRKQMWLSWRCRGIPCSLAKTFGDWERKGNIYFYVYSIYKRIIYLTCISLKLLADREEN